MSSRVHKVSDKYAGHRAELDRLRAVGATTRRARRTAKVVAGFDRAITTIMSHLDALPRRELLKLAKDQDIKGRHTMTKPRLLDAIKAEMRKG
jgi:hypothetical protein